MITIRNIPDTDALIDNPDEEDLDGYDFNFLILEPDDLPILADLGTPK